MEALHSKHFKTEVSLIDWANGKDGTTYIISIVKDASNGDFIIFYCK